MFSRSRSFALPLLVGIALIATASTGCSKTKPKPEVRVSDSQPLNGADGSRTLVDGTDGSNGGFAPAGGSRAGGAPDGEELGSTGEVGGAAGREGAAGRSAAGNAPGALTKDGSTGSLTNSASADGVENAVPSAELDMINFLYDSAEIEPDWQPVLDKHAEYIKANPNTKVQIEGHCDERGTEEYNIALGQKRADTVRNYLVSKGVDQNRLTTISYGKMRPLVTDGTPQGMASNRRAMFLVFETPAQ